MSSFDSILLSAAKTGNPPLSDPLLTSLSANGVNVITLSTNDIGIAYNQKDTLNSILSSFTIQGSLFKIDTAYHNTEMAVIKSPGQSPTTFTYLSSRADIPLSALNINDLNVSTVDSRRKWVYGYI